MFCKRGGVARGGIAIDNFFVVRLEFDYSCHVVFVQGLHLEIEEVGLPLSEHAFAADLRAIAQGLFQKFQNVTVGGQRKVQR